MSEFLATHVSDAITGLDLRDAAIREMLLTMMRTLAENEGRVEVICVGMPESVAFHVHCCPDDVAKLIGNGGRTARAVRGILKAIASKNGRKYTLVIAQ